MANYQPAPHPTTTYPSSNPEPTGFSQGQFASQQVKSSAFLAVLMLLFSPFGRWFPFWPRLVSWNTFPWSYSTQFNVSLSDKSRRLTEDAMEFPAMQWSFLKVNYGIQEWTSWQSRVKRPWWKFLGSDGFVSTFSLFPSSFSHLYLLLYEVYGKGTPCSPKSFRQFMLLHFSVK